MSATTAEQELVAPKVEPRRDRWGRYLIPGADGKPVGHTRATTVSGTLADSFSITGWKQRMVAQGLAKRPDLLALVASIGDTEANKDTKAQTSALVEDAMEAAGASSAANLGTALHAFIAQINEGHDPTPPPMWQPHIDEYRSAVTDAGLTVVPGMVEQICVIDALDEPIAGTLDIALTHPSWTLPRICDFKSGKTVDFGSAEWAIQLSLYAHAAHLYDPAGDSRSAMPAMDLETAMVIHLPAVSNPPVCTIYELDIAAGWEAAQLAVQVRAWRKRKGLLVSFSDKPSSATSDGPAVPVDPSPGPAGTADVLTNSAPAMAGRVRAVRDNLKRRVDGLTTDARGQVAARWPVGVATLRDEFLGEHTLDTLRLVEQVIDQVDAEHAAPFPDEPNPEHVPLPGDHPSIVAVVSRAQALPADIAADVLTEVRGVGITGKLTAGILPRELTAVEAILTGAELVTANRRERVGNALHVLGQRGIEPAVVAAAIGHTDGILDVTEWEAERIDDLADAADMLGVDNGRIVCTAPDSIRAHYGTGRELLAHAKRIAKQIDRPVPAKGADVFGDTLLVAALFVADGETQPTSNQPAAQETAA